MFQTTVVQEIKTQILCSITFFFPENPAAYEIMWKTILQQGRPRMTIWRMHMACWVRKATHTHTRTQYVILIAFHCNNGCKDAPECNVIRTLPVLLQSRMSHKDESSINLFCILETPCMISLLPCDLTRLIYDY